MNKTLMIAAVIGFVAGVLGFFGGFLAGSHIFGGASSTSYYGEENLPNLPGSTNGFYFAERAMSFSRVATGWENSSAGGRVSILASYLGAPSEKYSCSQGQRTPVSEGSQYAVVKTKDAIFVLEGQEIRLMSNPAVTSGALGGDAPAC